MREIQVTASHSYRVVIGSSVLQNLGSEIAKLHAPGKAVIVSDSNVWPLYGNTVKSSLHDAGYSVSHYTFPAGEQSKCADTYLRILDFIAGEHLTRSDILIALGGGVVGDITGFTAATYLRGISYVQVPTTLLAMVDSSVGGKTAIDLPAGKNLVGAFYQPDLVLCDIDALSSLPDSVFRDGCAEVIKYGILFDQELFEHLEKHGLGFNREDVIARCVELKRDVVHQDEFDTGCRQKLNLGHTLGHGIEACSDFTVTHGQAVAIGTALIARAACQQNICAPSVRDRIVKILTEFNLPTCTQYPPESLFQFALSDKKRTGKTVSLILPQDIGDCTIFPVSVENLLSFIKAGF